MKKVIIMIDGQNLFYELRSINIKENQINWTLFFKSLINLDNDELVRTYWFRPGRILDNYFTCDNIKYQIIKKMHPEYLRSPDSIPEPVLEDINNKVIQTERWLKATKEKFDRIAYNYDQLVLKFDDIELVKTGVVKVNPFSQVLIGEKGVDISLAVKMIELSVQNKCDKIILISGDFDYAEAIKFVKNNMTKIHLVKINKGEPPKNYSVSRELAVLADKIIEVYESNIKKEFLIS